MTPILRLMILEPRSMGDSFFSAAKVRVLEVISVKERVTIVDRNLFIWDLLHGFMLAGIDQNKGSRISRQDTHRDII
jgi:hypothetical protein